MGRAILNKHKGKKNSKATYATNRKFTIERSQNAKKDYHAYNWI